MKFKNCVYRFFNKEGEIIYIGKAKNLKNRLTNHTHLPQECYDEIVRIEYCAFKSEDELDLAERYLIPKYKPKYNTDFKQRKVSLVLHSFENLIWQIYIDKEKEEIDIEKYLLQNFDDCQELTHEILELKNSIKVLRKMMREHLNETDFVQRLSEKLEREELELNRKQKVKAKILLGEEYDYYSKEDIDLFIQYDIYNERMLGQTIYDEVVLKYLKSCMDEIEETGYYSMTRLSLNLVKEISDRFGGTAKWVYWYLSNGEIGCCSDECIKEFYLTLIKTIEKVLEEQYGEFERVLQELSSNDSLRHYFMRKGIDIPIAHVIKRLIKQD